MNNAVKITLFTVIYGILFFVGRFVALSISPDQQNNYSLACTILTVLYWIAAWGSIIKDGYDTKKQV